MINNLYCIFESDQLNLWQEWFSPWRAHFEVWEPGKVGPAYL
ncbi:hypothetical protein NC99_18870 [Sunxiuqinia dokdonensis]|uniref:Uncharacterized protein n=1 Tax=Sunxiuqinia dokdonensis TaxID=1409788 RepID=A0A0L8VA22_9BACT|nr:hypothetical protein NC99_18870 [Sunxiuqinia dokdonensis]